MEFFQTIVWMHHLDPNKTNGEKARWELGNNTNGCFEQIQEAALHKTAAVQPPTTYLINQPRHTGHC